MSKIIGKQVLLANQTYVDNSSLINVPNTTITGRAQILDPSKDLSINMGINRIPIQNIYLLQNEFGPNGEPVYAAVNDSFGLIRFAGTWASNKDSSGQYVISQVSGDFVEVTFYGTGLNAIMDLNATGVRDFRSTVDGGTESGNLIPPSLSGILDGRNYNPNQLFNLASGLALGTHTIKLRNNAAASVIIAGFEILNESSSIKVNPGTSYISGASAVLTSQFTDSFNSNFTNTYGTAGSRGGRVLVYQKPDGSIAKDIQYTNTASATLTSADHTNEEVSRTIYWREFGAGRADDFSQFVSNAANNRSFTLDDGTTTLFGSSIGQADSNHDTIGLNTNGGFLEITFVGTGLDILQQDNIAGGADTYNVQIDGGSTISLPSAGNTTLRQTKIVSGLPYGTHVVTFNRVTAGTWTLGILAFKVYQPKTPALPSGCVQIADYNLMATYVAGTTAGTDTIATGVLRKAMAREAIYSGTWAIGSPGGDPGIVTGVAESGSVSGNYVEYTFFGTGFEFRARTTTTRAATVPVTINGLAATTANFPTLVSSTYGGWSFSAGTFNESSGGTTNGAGLSINSLPLGKYTVRFTNNTSSLFAIEAIDVITPIYADGSKQNTPGNFQNSLSVGSQSIHDNRLVGPNSIAATAQKFRASAIGLTSGPTTTSTTYIPFQDLSLTVPSKGAWFQVSYNAGVSNNGGTALLSIFVNGVQETGTELGTDVASGVTAVVSCTKPIYLSPGVHKIDVYWKTSGTSSTGNSIRRIVTVQEV